MKHFVLISFPGIDLDFPLQSAKREVETRLTRSGLTYTILQPTCFNEVWLSPALGFDVAHATARIYGDGHHRVSWISLHDVALFTVAALEGPRADNAVIRLGGPEALNPLDVVQLAERLTGRTFAVEYVPETALRAQYDAATDPMEKTFAALMLYYARGDVVDMAAPLRLFAVPPLRTVYEHLQSSVLQVRARGVARHDWPRRWRGGRRWKFRAAATSSALNRADPADRISRDRCQPTAPFRFRSTAGSFPHRFWPSAATPPGLLSADLIAGVTVGLVALPLAMAFAISSGMTPQAGHLLRHRHRVHHLGASADPPCRSAGRPARSSWSCRGIIATHGVDGLFMCTMMAGVILVVMGLTGTGTAVRFIPRPVVTGFTGGIAVTIASTQLQDFFGITLARRRARRVHRPHPRAGAARRHRVGADHGPGRGRRRR